MKILIIVTAFILNAFSEEYKPTPISDVEMNCGNEISSSIAWEYCISSYKKSTSKKVIYHLHGRNGNATWWNDSTYHTGKIYQEWVDSNYDVPTVISISFGKLWLLTKNANQTGLRDIFLNEVIRNIEKKLTFQVESRAIFGISMGGLNAFYLSMSNSGLFSKSAIICAHIPFISHYSGIYSIFNYALENKVSVKRSYMMYQFSKHFFKTVDDWELNSPLELLNNFDPKKSPSLYLTCGEKDDWGCMKVSEQVAAKVNSMQGTAAWIPREGGHCDMDYASLAKFLAF